MSRILALDQASLVTGYAVLDQDGKLIKASHITLSSNKTLAQRLVKLRQCIIDIIKEYDITEVIMEDIQLEEGRINNVQTFKALAEVYGVIQELVTELSLKLEAVYASTWKSAVGIKKSKRELEKRQAQEIVRSQFQFEPTEDEADAVCIAYYYWNKNNAAATFDWAN